MSSLWTSIWQENVSADSGCGEHAICCCSCSVVSIPIYVAFECTPILSQTVPVSVVTSLAFSAVAVSTATDSQIRIWDLEHHQQLRLIEAGAGT